MSRFREMLCTMVYGGHLLNSGDIAQLGVGTSDHSFNYEYWVVCARCGKMSVVERKLLEDMMRKDYERPNQSE